MLQVELRVASGKQTGASIPLPAGKFLVGREEDCHLRPNSEAVSRHHCVFTVDDFACRLRDLGSTNGTFVNGERIRAAVVLKHGDRVAIGKLDFEVVVNDPSAIDTRMNIDIETGTQVNLPQQAPPAPVGQVLAVEEVSEPSSSDTLMEMPAVPTSDTQFAPQPGMPMQAPVGYPMGYPPAYMPYGYPQQMPMGYPQMQMGYPPQMPMGYPPQMGYPQMQQMPMTMAAPAPAAAAPTPGTEASGIPTKLPDPSDTGAKEPEKKPDTPGGDKKAELKIKDVAGDVIKQYLNRRPNTGG